MPKKKEQLSFEDAIEHLDEMVARLEGAAMPLKEAVQLFSDSQNLIALCEKELHQAEKQVKKLIKTSSGFELEDFEAMSE